MYKILFISSKITGNGHNSMVQALNNQFEKLNPEIHLEEVDAFYLGGVFTKNMAKLYNKIAVLTPNLWGVIYKMGNKFKKPVNFFAEHNIKNNFIKLIKENRPNLIITVHPGFVGSINNILQKNEFDIPVVVVIADLDNVSHLWGDKRTLYTICPSQESYNTMLKIGIPEERLKLFGFPTRDKFNHINSKNAFMETYRTICNRRLNFLIMNGSQGGRTSKQIAENLLENFDCNVTILAGKNTILKKSLEDYLKPKYSDRVTICGFTDKVEYYMMNSDILFVRASPNVLMEAVNLCKPIIMTGSFTGQEEKNPQYIENNNLGVQCKDINSLPQIVNDLIADDGKKLKEIVKSQIEFRKPEAAADIVKFVSNTLYEFEKAEGM